MDELIGIRQRLEQRELEIDEWQRNLDMAYSGRVDPVVILGDLERGLQGMQVALDASEKRIETDVAAMNRRVRVKSLGWLPEKMGYLEYVSLWGVT